MPFWWAKFRKAKGGVKLQNLYDINTQIPAFLHIIAANVFYVKGIDELVYESRAHYIFDRAYLDYIRLYKIELCSSYLGFGQKQILISGGYNPVKAISLLGSDFIKLEN